MTSTKKIMLIVLNLFAMNCFSQKKEPANLYIYRTNRFLYSNYNFDVSLNGKNVITLKRNCALEYHVFSEGNLNVSAKTHIMGWSTNTFMNIESGKSYYIKVDISLGRIVINTNSAKGIKQWPKASSNNLSVMAEDPDQPIIQMRAHEAPTILVKTDTVKQVIYVNDSKKYNYVPYADVDTQVPSFEKSNETTFALIIGNEDYSSYQLGLQPEKNVEYARNDASAFKTYAIKTLGIPEKNITLILDGTYGQIVQGLSKMNLIAKNMDGKAQFIVYYAGHGMPDENTKEPYIIPVDVEGTNVTAAIKLKDFYSKLTEYPSQKVTVFLDACFTGGARGQGLVALRGISIKPKEEPLKGNLVVFNSSSDNQSSLSYNDKKHGLFTYYLLKKLQETKGDISLKDLSAYLKEKVSLETLLINNREQNPETNFSSDISDKWGDWKLNQ